MRMSISGIDDGAGTEIDHGRIFPLALPDASMTRTWELLLVSIGTLAG